MDTRLRHLYEPSSIAVVGPSPNKNNLATVILSNLLSSVQNGKLKAKVQAVNPLYDECLNVKCQKEIESGTELVIIAVPAPLVEGYLLQAQRAGADVAIVISGGFTESGGKSLKSIIHGTRVLGPNTIGIVDPYSGINTMFLPVFKNSSDGVSFRSLPDPMKGSVSIIAQSGGLSVSLYDELLSSGVGIRALTCLGNSDDIDAADIVEYFSEDELTSLIAIYLEGIREGRKLMNALSRAAVKKRVIILLAGTSEVGKRATYSHTGSIVSNTDVYLAAMKQAGALAVRDFRDFIAIIKSYRMIGAVNGNGTAILTNSGGAGVLAADEASYNGMHVPALHNRLIGLKDNGLLPRIASVENPIDVSASGTDNSFVAVYEQLIKFEDVDSIVIISTHYPPGITDLLPSKIASLYRSSKKPTVAVELGRSQWSNLFREIYEKNGIPAFDSPQQAVRILSMLYKLNQIKPTWAPVVSQLKLEISPGIHVEPELSDKITQFGFKSPSWKWISNYEDLEKLNYPIALKVVSEGILHKTEAGAVKVNIANTADAIDALNNFRKIFSNGKIYAQEMIKGVEIRVGIATDPAFGKFIDIGAGGVLTELLTDHSTAIAPVSTEEALAMLESLKITKLLKGYRSEVIADIESLAASISLLSAWAASYEKLKEIEINPLIVNSSGAYAVDIRAIV